MGLLDFSITQAGVDLMPPVYKEPKHKAWVESLLAPLQEFLDNTYKPATTELGYLARFNGQTIVLEGLLNHELSISSAPLIYIENNRGYKPPIYFFNEAEGFTPHYFELDPTDPFYLYLQSEVTPIFSFTVWVPVLAYQEYNTANGTSLTSLEFLSLVDSQVRKYKISGVTYNILTY